MDSLWARVVLEAIPILWQRVLVVLNYLLATPQQLITLMALPILAVVAVVAVVVTPMVAEGALVAVLVVLVLMWPAAVGPVFWAASVVLVVLGFLRAFLLAAVAAAGYSLEPAEWLLLLPTTRAQPVMAERLAGVGRHNLLSKVAQQAVRAVLAPLLVALVALQYARDLVLPVAVVDGVRQGALQLVLTRHRQVLQVAQAVKLLH
jgi:hypothetical protein